MRHIKVIEILLNDKNIDVNIGIFIDGSTPFSIASKKGHKEIMEKLINHVNIKEGKGWAIDSWASRFRRSTIKTEPTMTNATIVTTTEKGYFLSLCS